MGKDADLLKAAEEGDLATVERLTAKKQTGKLQSLRRGPSVNTSDASGFTSLHFAALNGNYEICQHLLKLEANANARDQKGSTPLHLAAWGGHAQVASLLLTGKSQNTRAAVNSKAMNGETPLHSAAQHGHAECLAKLLKFGGDATCRSARSETPLDLAAQYGRKDVVELLLAHKSELVHDACSKWTPLHLAARNGHDEVVSILIRHGVDVNAATENGTALHEAALYGKASVVELLLAAGIDTQLRSPQGGETALEMLADIKSEQAAEIRLLIEGAASTPALPAKQEGPTEAAAAAAADSNPTYDVPANCKRAAPVAPIAQEAAEDEGRVRSSSINPFLTDAVDDAPASEAISAAAASLFFNVGQTDAKVEAVVASTTADPENPFEVGAVSPVKPDPPSEAFAVSFDDPAPAPTGAEAQVPDVAPPPEPAAEPAATTPPAAAVAAADETEEIPDGPPTNVRQLLLKCSLGNMEPMLARNAFDSLSFLPLITAGDLAVIGAEEEDSQALLGALSFAPPVVFPDAPDVVTWLDGLGLAQYAGVFHAAGVAEMAQVAALTDGALVDAGVALLGHRTRLLHAASHLASTVPAPAVTQAPPKAAEPVADASPATGAVAPEPVPATTVEAETRSSPAVDTTFTVQYVGSRVVKAMGPGATETALNKMRAKIIPGKPPIMLNLSKDAIKFIDPSSQIVVVEHAVSTVSTHARVEDMFGYITTDNRPDGTQKHYCHTFAVESPSIASDAMAVLSKLTSSQNASLPAAEQQPAAPKDAAANSVTGEAKAKEDSDAAAEAEAEAAVKTDAEAEAAAKAEAEAEAEAAAKAEAEAVAKAEAEAAAKAEAEAVAEAEAAAKAEAEAEAAAKAEAEAVAKAEAEAAAKAEAEAKAAAKAEAEAEAAAKAKAEADAATKAMTDQIAELERQAAELELEQSLKEQREAEEKVKEESSAAQEAAEKEHRAAQALKKSHEENRLRELEAEKKALELEKAGQFVSEEEKRRMAVDTDAAAARAAELSFDFDFG